MKKIGLIILIAFLGITVQAQQKAYASIDTKCIQQPATLVIGNSAATGFSISTLTAGNNCYNGSPFRNTGFVIKAANGVVVYQYQRDEKGKVTESGGTLSTLVLGGGTYTVWVDGGKGASLVLNYRI